MEKTFGEFLKQKRQEKNLTQKELAELLFVSPSAVSKWEKDVAHPDISLLTKLSQLLGVTEHELITASVDNETREERKQAKKWRALVTTWDLFFYISYCVALISCFICNLAIDKTLSWFWIVLSALILSFTFTNLPKSIKKYKLILIPLSEYLALCLLLGVCAIYTHGNWFFVASVSVLLGLIIIFVPIIIATYKPFEKLRKANDFISVFIDFIVLNILLLVIYGYTVTNNFTAERWYFSIALPIVLFLYAVINLLLSVRLLKLNKLLNTSIILLLTNFLLYIVPLFIKVDNEKARQELNDLNIFKANFSNWVPDVCLENNVHCLIFLTALLTAIVFLVFGLIKHLKNKNKA